MLEKRRHSGCFSAQRIAAPAAHPRKMAEMLDAPVREVCMKNGGPMRSIAAIQSLLPGCPFRYGLQLGSPSRELGTSHHSMQLFAVRRSTIGDRTGGQIHACGASRRNHWPVPESGTNRDDAGCLPGASGAAGLRRPCSGTAAALFGLAVSARAAKSDALRHARAREDGAGGSGATLDAPISGAIAVT